MLKLVGASVLSASLVLGSAWAAEEPAPATPDGKSCSGTGRPPANDLTSAPDAHFYPPISKRLGEQGTVAVLVLVAPDGHVVDAVLGAPSAFSRLDVAAVNYAKSGQLHFEPFCSDKSVLLRFQVIFRLATR